MIASRKKGCLIGISLASILLVWTCWQIGEPDRRARRIHNALRMGMTYREVQGLMTGRHYCIPQVRTNGQWQSLSEPDFANLITTAPTNTFPEVRLKLHFMGMAPRRVSFTVELNHFGTVTNVTYPCGWD